MKAANTYYRLCIAVVLLSNVAQAENWGQWRGPNLNGSTSETGLPEKLDVNGNLVWKSPMPGHGDGTPIVWGDRVFVSSLDKQTQRLLALCIDNKSGQILWKREVGDGFVSNARNDLTGPSPVTDGKFVWFYYGSGDLAAFDLDGKPQWSRNIQNEYGQFTIKWLYSSSPLLFDGRLYIQVIHSGNSYLLAVNPLTGKDIFKHPRPNNARAESREAYTSPIAHENAGRKEVILIGGDCVTGHDAATGNELWRFGGWNPRSEGNWRVVCSPVVLDQTLIFCTPQAQSRVVAFKLGGSGDISRSHRAWENNQAKSDVPVPLVYQGKLFVLDGDFRKGIYCINPTDGQTQWSASIESRPVFRSSPTGADGKIYLMNEDAEVWVMSARDGKILSNTTLDNDGTARGSIVAAQGRIYVRTGSTLYCFEKSN